jgi:DNA polymerase III alpha subunit
MARVRTGYSFRAAVGKLPNVLDRLVECGYEAAPMTDRASTFGWVKWSALCAERDIRPVFGVELAVSTNPWAKKPMVDYWTFIAKDDLKVINELVHTATNQFRYQPMLDYGQAQQADCFKIVGSKSDLSKVMPMLDMFASLGPSTSKGYITQILKLGLRPIACSDNYYPVVDDLGFYEIVVGRNASIQTYDQHIQTPEEWENSVSRLGLERATVAAAVANRSSVLSSSTAELRRASLMVPEHPKTLRQMCLDGAKELGCNLKDPIYKERLKYELGLIQEKDYQDYFYIVADICVFARSRMVVGPARGSSCGSLVCYLLGITTVDPIPHGLIFERFIDINRDDLPDIDIDFSDQNRQDVFDYVANKYGPEHVARLGTVAMYKSRSALQETAKALNVPPWKSDAVAESLIERSSGDSRALQTLEDTFITMPAGQDLIKEFPGMAIAAKMEGHPRHYSQHAAGIVIAEEEITDIMAVDIRSGSTMCDKYDAESLNLLKIDALGLTQLSVFEDCLDMIGMHRDELDNLPRDDPAAFKVLNDAHFAGIFQFNGQALQSITKQFTVKEFYDIVSVTALGRPGPLASGGAHEWIRRKNGTNAVTYPHEVFRPYLEDTMGIVLYQEQVMEIGRNIGGLDWGQVTALRKAMSRSLGKEYFDQFGDPWKKGALALGVSKEDADKVWDDLCAYGAWSFNKSHSVAYGVISYQCCWLKAHYPLEFAAATLTHQDDPVRKIQLLRELHEEGYEYIPVDSEMSTDKWTVGERDGKRMLVGPLSSVKGIGPALMHQILDDRNCGIRHSDRAKKLLQNPKTDIDTLWPVRDAIKRIMPDPAERNIHTPPTNIIDLQIKKNDYTALVLCTLSKINPRDENEVVIVARRGYRIQDHMTTSLNLQLTDDTDTIFGKIDRYRYNELGRPIVNHGKVGKALYAIKGKVRGGGSFRMMLIQNIRYIGDIS